MYRNCVYNNKTKSISLWTWDASGRRVCQELDYNPYLYLEDKNGTDKSIYGTTLKKREFKDQWERGKFVKESGIKRIFENLPPYQQFLIDNYYHCCDDEEFGKNELKTMFIDLETYDSKNTGIFSDAEAAEHVINVISCYDTLSKQFMVFGLNPYTPKASNVKFIYCQSEEKLLKSFINYFSSDFPDILSGWFSNSFDVPYLINRIIGELGKEWADELSPIGRIWQKQVQIKEGKRVLRVEKRYVIEGISCIDYLELYKKFMVGKEKHESYKLDYIAEIELGENKLEFDGSFKEFADNEWERFVDYNIQDVNILVRLDEKKKFINLLKTLSYVGLCSFEKGMETVPLINGAISVRARMRNEKIPTFIVKANSEEFAGGYVSPPNPGFYENIVSFDANSLYPSIIISVNISPETKLGKVEQVGDKIILNHVSGRQFELTKEKFLEYITTEKAALASSGFLFSQKKMGIIPEFLDMLYRKRKLMKTKMLDVESRMNDSSLSENDLKKLKTEAQLYDSIQHAMKITLNACYGYTGNPYAPLSDKDLAVSVTLTGQAAIKKSKDVFIEFLANRFPDKTPEELEKGYLYSDSDSLYSCLKMFEEHGIYLKDGEEVSKDFHKLCSEVEEYMNDGIEKWAMTKLRSINSRFVFKRETICDIGIFLEKKKRYVLHVLDSEGVKVDKFKYTGVDVVNSTMPKKLKPHVKKIIETMLKTQSREETSKEFNNVYELFKDLKHRDISIIKGMNKYEEYSKTCQELTMTSKMPFHLKAAYYHDYIVKSLGLNKKYEKFRSGEKVRVLYVKTPNKYGVDLIGFKSKYPPEFEEIFEIDYEKMFEKILFSAIERFYSAVNWKLRKPNENVRVELEDLLY